MANKWILFLALVYVLSSCNEGTAESIEDIADSVDETPDDAQSAILEMFGGTIDLNNIPNYESQEIPDYIDDDNTEMNTITDEGALLGRVLFYDVNLSSDNTISCASCHQQAFAFSDPNITSTGVNGTTGRHSMRLVNARFADEENFFWDERAGSLEEQTTMPIQDHIEMGFSGTEGDNTIEELYDKLEAIDFYNELFTFVYGDTQVTEERIQESLAQFIGSIQSFDSKYDEGRAQVNDDDEIFPNFTALENQGKTLYMRGPRLDNNGIRVDGGIGCNTCHQAPEFDIDDDSRNNGMITSLNDPNELDDEVTRSPSLRDLFNNTGVANGPFMHNGFSSDFEDVLDHYGNIPQEAVGNGLDRRLSENGNAQVLNMTDDEKEAVIAFIMTLIGTDVYSNEKWSNPFDRK